MYLQGKYDCVHMRTITYIFECQVGELSLITKLDTLSVIITAKNKLNDYIVIQLVKLILNLRILLL